MDDLQRAIEQACRHIEGCMAGRGQKVVVDLEGMRSDVSPVHPDLHKVTATLLVKRLGKRSKTEVVKLREEDKAQRLEDITDVGHRAGVRALLEKYQQAIQNATDLAEGRPTKTGIQQVTEHAKMLRPDDPVPKMLIAVAQLRKTLCERNQELLDLSDKLKEKKDPEEQLRERLKLKMRAKYVEKTQVLREFQTYLFENYSAMFPEHLPGRPEGIDVVSEFLERLGDDQE